MSLILALSRPKQEGGKFEASLSYKAKPYLKKKKKMTRKQPRCPLVNEQINSDEHIHLRVQWIIDLLKNDYLHMCVCVCVCVCC
jgi:hypothetical protein